MSKPFRINTHCVVRHQDCKRIFEGSKICFIASPGSEEVALELEIIKQKLRETNIEPYIAVEQREFQKDVFCEKICTKIIESQFCIVILNDVINNADNLRKPNANVYYEYGLMTSFCKKIIPIQLEGQSLAFNIQSLDTLKYTNKEFPRQIEEAIKITLLSLDSEENKESAHAFLEWILDFIGLVKLDERFDFRVARSLSIRQLGFAFYKEPKSGRLHLVGLFPEEEKDNNIILNSKILTLRFKNYCDQLSNESLEIEKEITEANRPRTLSEGKLIDLKKTLSILRESKILIVKDTNQNIDSYLDAYHDACKDIELNLELETINRTKAFKIINK